MVWVLLRNGTHSEQTFSSWEYISQRTFASGNLLPMVMVSVSPILTELFIVTHNGL